MGKIKDITGQRFGRLTAIKMVGYKESKYGNSAVWLCHCDCGNDVEIVGSQLRCGHTKSCGCIHREVLIKNNKERANKNNYDLSGEYGIGYDHNGNKFYFDLEDYDKIKDYYWLVNKNGYVVTSNNKKHMHRVIMDIDSETWRNVQVDHIHGDGNRNDNSKDNLRIVTPSQNGMNKKIYYNNTSGYTGVYWIKSRNRWASYITVESNIIYLGSYLNKEDAIQARKQAEEKYFGEYSYDNSQAV